jgi:hypothetical protein
VRPGRCLGPRARRGGAAAAAALAALAFAAPARAQGRTASLGWARLPGAERCAGGGAMARAVETILRRPAIAPASRADLVLEGRVEPVPGRPRFRAIVEVTTQDGEVVGARTIESPGEECGGLDEPVALAIALMIDPDAMMAPPEPAPDPAPPAPVTAIVRDVLFVPVPVTVSPVSPAPAPRAAPSAGEGPWIGFSAGPSLAAGLVPGVAPGLRVGVEVGPPADRAPEGLTWGPSSIRLGMAVHGGSVEVTDAVRVDHASLSLGAWLARLELCPTTAWVGTRVAVTACAAVDAGAVTYTGESFDSPVAGGARGFVALGPTLRGRVGVLGPVAIELGVGAVAPLVRDRFVYGRATGTRALAHQAAPLGGSLDLGLHVGL